MYFPKYIFQSQRIGAAAGVPPGQSFAWLRPNRLQRQTPQALKPFAANQIVLQVGEIFCRESNRFTGFKKGLKSSYFQPINTIPRFPHSPPTKNQTNKNNNNYYPAAAENQSFWQVGNRFWNLIEVEATKVCKIVLTQIWWNDISLARGSGQRWEQQKYLFSENSLFSSYAKRSDQVCGASWVFWWFGEKQTKPRYVRNSSNSSNCTTSIRSLSFHYTLIPDICHFFYTHIFWGLKILHSKVRKFTTKVASRQNSVITHCA